MHLISSTGTWVPKERASCREHNQLMENRYWLYSVQQLAAKLNDVEQCTFRISSPTIPHPNRRHPLQLIILSKILNSASDSSKIYGGHLGRDVGKIQPPNWSRAFFFLIICTALSLGTDLWAPLTTLVRRPRYASHRVPIILGTYTSTSKVAVDL